MSIDNIPLPAFLYQSLFGKSLVDLKAGVTAPVIKKEPGINFLGGNEKKIVFLVNDPQNKFLADNQVNFLFDLLTACHLTIGDVALVNLFHNNTVTYRELTGGLQAKKILIFGIPAQALDLPFTIPFFQMQNFQEQVYMTSPSIPEIQMNTELRKQLWKCLQKIFNLRKEK